MRSVSRISDHKKILPFICAALILFSSCDKSRVFDKNESVGKAGWPYGEKKSFEVNITDTSSAYNMYINIRHTDAYPYSNIWLTITTIFPDSSVISSRANVQLAEPTGEWTGDCVDGICYNSVLIKTDFHFSRLGKYTFQLEQDMRMNPLPSIMDAGVKIEKFNLPQ